jgi:hypothetical protein
MNLKVLELAGLCVWIVCLLFMQVAWKRVKLKMKRWKNISLHVAGGIMNELETNKKDEMNDLLFEIIL